jgi:methionyl-tRNA synthetase
MAAGIEVPKRVFVHGFLLIDEKKMSKSLGNVIDPFKVIDLYGVDALRYYLVAAGPETQDADFTWADFVRRNNDELLANWGNLVNRTLTSAYRNFGAVPDAGELTEVDRALLATVDRAFDDVGELIEGVRFRAALAEVMRISTQVNQYVSDQAPWSVVKTDRDRAATVLYVALRAIDSLKVIFAPFLPHTSQLLHELLGYDGWLAGPIEFRAVEEDDGRTHEVLTGDYSSWSGRWAPSELRPGRPLTEPRPLFRKLDPELAEVELANADAA